MYISQTERVKDNMNNNILGNRERKSVVDVDLYKKVNDRYSGNIENVEEKPLQKTVVSQDTSLENKLVFDSDNIPRIKLESIPLAAICVSSQKEYDTLMQVYECGGWEWTSGLSTDFNAMLRDNGNLISEIYIAAHLTRSERINGYAANILAYDTWNAISTQEFYKLQNISKDDIEKISVWYDINRPNRKSKG